MTDQRRKPPLPGRKNLRYDRHGDIVIEDLDDACGATVVPSDEQASSRWLARAPLAWGRR